MSKTKLTPAEKARATRAKNVSGSITGNGPEDISSASQTPRLQRQAMTDAKQKKVWLATKVSRKRAASSAVQAEKPLKQARADKNDSGQQEPLRFTDDEKVEAHKQTTKSRRKSAKQISPVDDDSDSNSESLSENTDTPKIDDSDESGDDVIDTVKGDPKKLKAVLDLERPRFTNGTKSSVVQTKGHRSSGVSLVNNSKTSEDSSADENIGSHHRTPRPATSKQTGLKKPGKREEQQRMEQPVFRSADDNKSESNMSDELPESWPPSTKLEFNGGVKANLNSQQAHIQSLLRTAISLSHQHLAFEDAYPDLNEKRRIMADALHAASKSEKGCEDVRLRLKHDAQYVRALAYVPEGRVSKFRNDFKAAAERRVPAALGLEKNPAGVAKAKALLNDDIYLFPLDANGNPIRKKPFQSPAILYTIEAACFGNPTSVGIKYHHLFTSTRDDRPDELELPVAMVALAATAVQAVIMDYASGSDEALEFDTTVFGGIYAKLVKTINSLFEENEKKYHALMSTLYNLTYGSKHNQDTATTFAIEFDLDGMSED